MDKDEIIYDEELASKNVFNYAQSHKNNQMDHKSKVEMNWLLQVIDRPCPQRKIGKFKNLKKLNKKVITIYDIFRVTGLRNKYDFIVNEVEEKVKQKIKNI